MEKGEFTITNTIVECYKIRHSSGMYWADIIIDSNGSNSGRISIASDYGNWQNYWGACGENFKKFLIGLDKYYTAGKFGCSKWFDAEKTIAEYRSVIKENIKDGYLDEETGVNALGELQSLEESSCQEEFCRNLEDCGIIMRLYDHCPALIYSIDPSFNNFWDNVWLVFTSQLKEEMN